MPTPRLVPLTLPLLILLTTLARGDGMFVWRGETTDIREPEQKALLVFDDGLEDLVLSVRYTGAVEDFGWIIPVPSRPRMRADDPQLFVRLSMHTQGVYSRRSERGARMGMARALATEPDVRVLQEATVGIYDAAVLRTANTGALARWLDAHGYRAPPRGAPILADYARRGWMFVAVRISPAHRDSATQRSMADGTVQPLRLRFRTREPVYPLRVSAAGASATQVLLYVVAREPLVHLGKGGAVWTEDACGPAVEFIGIDPDSAFPRLLGGRGYLTKLRATLAPHEMADVHFKPYDPMAGLTSPNEAQRIEAVTHLGLLKPPGATARLVAFLKSRRDENETLSALWSLGETGGRDAVTVLLNRAETGPLPARLEAIESLSRLEAHDALPVYLRGLTLPAVRFPWNRARDQSRKDEITLACFEHVTTRGDRSCVAPLRRMLATCPRPDRNGYEISRRDRILGALAASGDPAARDTIVRRLVEGSVLTHREALTRIRNTGSINYFPSGLWTAAQMLHGDWYSGWRELGIWHQLLAVRPDAHDEVLRRAAHAGIPPVGLSMLMGLLARPRPADAETLLVIARAGLGAESLSVVLSVGSPGAQTPVRYDVQTCTAVYALGRQRAIRQLLALWREVPADHHELRGEMTVAMSLADTSAALAALMEYVRSEWNARASSTAYVDGVFASADRNNRRVPPRCAPADWDLRDIDLAYRVPGITERIARHAPPESLLSLVTDRSLSPWLRLFWAYHFPGYEQRLRPWMPAVRQSLDDMARIYRADPGIQYGIAGARSYMDIADKVYAEDVALGASPWK